MTESVEEDGARDTSGMEGAKREVGSRVDGDRKKISLDSKHVVQGRKHEVEGGKVEKRARTVELWQ